MPDCIFCKIIQGKIPCNKVYEDKNFFAFLDKNPAKKGHILVTPKKHCYTILDCDDKTLKDIMPVIKKIAKKVKSISDGYNVLVNNFEAAGQVVPHLHFHIVPRFKDDADIFNRRQVKYENNEIEEYQRKLSIK